MSQLISLLQAAIIFGTVILYGAMGEILTEKSGNLNLGVPGIMYLGGICGLMGVFFYEMNNPNPNGFVCILIAVSCAFLAAMLGGLLFSVLTITLRANQNVTGLTLTIFASGFANFFGGSLNKLAGGVGQISVAATSAAFRWTPAFLKNWGDFGLLPVRLYGIPWPHPGLRALLVHQQDQHRPKSPCCGRKSRHRGCSGYQCYQI